MISFEAALKTIAAAIPGTLGGAIAGYLVNRRMENVRRGLRLKEEHLQKLKQDVLQILLNQIVAYYEPIGERQLGAVVSWPTQIVKQPESVTDQSYVRTEYKLRVRPLLPRNDDPFGRVSAPPLDTADFSHYYPDARQNHFPDMLKDWEDYKASFEEIAQQYLKQAEELAKDLRELLKLPARLASHSDEKTWVNYETLAVFLYEHALGINQAHLYIQDYSPDVHTRICFSGSQDQVAQGADPSRTREILASVAKKAKDLAPKAAEISRALERLQPRHKELVQRLRDALNNNQLPKTCSFTGE